MDIKDLSSASVAICDDSITNVMILAKLLESEGIKDVNSFTDPRKVLPFIKDRHGELDLLLLDIEMPYMSGFDVMAAIDAEYPDGHPFAILVITGLMEKEVRHHALSAGANDFLDKPFDPLEVILRSRNLLRAQLALKLQTQISEHLETEVKKRTQELDNTVHLLVHLLALAGEMRDNETGKHVARVGRYSRILAEAIGLPPDLCQMIELAAPLHDAGKIGIPDCILHKNGNLNEEERMEMNQHTIKGLQLLGEYGQDSMLLQMAASVALNHHERWDGTGYPHGKHGESIPIEGRIVSIADVFDALTTRRPYKDPWSLDKTVAFLQENAGKQFDPTLINVFVSKLDRIESVMHELADTV